MRQSLAALDEDEIDVASPGVQRHEDAGGPQSRGNALAPVGRPGEGLAQGIEEPIRIQPRCSSTPAPRSTKRKSPSAIRYPTKTITDRRFKKAIRPAMAA